MEKFFKDKKRIFECNITVEGANIADTSARLLLEFGNQTLLFRGNVSSDGKCTIEVPALKHINENRGKAILEVISESSLFEAWQSEFELKESKTVKVEITSPKPILESKVKVITKPLIEEEDEFSKTPIIETFIKELKKQNISEQNIKRKEKEVKLVYSTIKKRFNPTELKYLTNNITKCIKLL